MLPFSRCPELCGALQTDEMSRRGHTHTLLLSACTCRDPHRHLRSLQLSGQPLFVRLAELACATRIVRVAQTSRTPDRTSFLRALRMEGGGGGGGDLGEYLSLYAVLNVRRVNFVAGSMWSSVVPAQKPSGTSGSGVPVSLNQVTIPLARAPESSSARWCADHPGGRSKVRAVEPAAQGVELSLGGHVPRSL